MCFCATERGLHEGELVRLARGLGRVAGTPKFGLSLERGITTLAADGRASVAAGRPRRSLRAVGRGRPSAFHWNGHSTTQRYAD